MDLSIVIVNWNTRDLLDRCLQSLYATAEELSFEVLVVDNGSMDGSIDLIRERYPQVRLVANQENLGFARANNQGIRESSGRYILLLNSDTEVQKRALEELVRWLDEHPDAGACGPLLLNTDGSLQVSCHPMLSPEREFWRLIFLDRLWRRATYDQARWDRSKPRQAEVLKGACICMRREALDQVGLLDERYFMYTEEMDLCYRLLQAGWTVWWVPTSHVIHAGEASTRQMREQMYVQLYRSKAQFYRKVGGAHAVRRFRLLMQVAYLPRFLVMCLGAWLQSEWRLRARIYRRLLAELPSM